MNLPTFYDYVDAHPELEGVSISKDGQFSVYHPLTKFTTTVDIGAIMDLGWDVLEDIFTGKREPEVIYHMSRVCGYYSRPENWNGSKIAELADRHKGNYTIV